MWGLGSKREQCCLLNSQLSFSHFLCFPQSNWALWCWIPGGWFLCMLSDPVGFSSELSCVARSFSHWHNSHNFLQPEVLRLFPQRLFPHAGTLGFAVCLAPHLFLPVYPPSLLATALPTQSSSHCLATLHISAPPTNLNEYFFFNSLIVGVPYSSIFWQFWLFFVSKFVVLLVA